MLRSDWDNSADTPLLPDGNYVGTVAQIIYGKSGIPFVSGNGDPQIMVVFVAEGGRASHFYTLDERKVWDVWRLLESVGSSREEFELVGHKVRDLAKPEVAEALLLGKALAFNVERRCGNHYPHVSTLDRRAYEAMSTGVEETEDPDPFEV